MACIRTRRHLTMWQRPILCTIIIIIGISIFPRTVRGHGRLIDPPARNSMWRFGFDNPVNYNDNELYCGGRMVQWLKNSGKCGICGDSYHGDRPHEAGGKFANGIITKTYEEGAEMDITVHLTANHLGFFEFRICPNNDPKQRVKQECLDKYLLERADGQGTIFNVPKGKYNAMFNYTLKLPRGLTCTQCVIQWKYRTGNTWDKDHSSGRFCLGCGPQEEFYNCADVSIEARRPAVIEYPTRQPDPPRYTPPTFNLPTVASHRTIYPKPTPRKFGSTSTRKFIVSTQIYPNTTVVSKTTSPPTPSPTTITNTTSPTTTVIITTFSKSRGTLSTAKNKPILTTTEKTRGKTTSLAQTHNSTQQESKPKVVLQRVTAKGNKKPTKRPTIRNPYLKWTTRTTVKNPYKKLPTPDWWTIKPKITTTQSVNTTQRPTVVTSTKLQLTTTTATTVKISSSTIQNIRSTATTPPATITTTQPATTMQSTIKPTTPTTRRTWATPTTRDPIARTPTPFPTTKLVKWWTNKPEPSTTKIRIPTYQITQQSTREHNETSPTVTLPELTTPPLWWPPIWLPWTPVDKITKDPITTKKVKTILISTPSTTLTVPTSMETRPVTAKTLYPATRDKMAGIGPEPQPNDVIKVADRFYGKAGKGESLPWYIGGDMTWKSWSSSESESTKLYEKEAAVVKQMTTTVRSTTTTTTKPSTSPPCLHSTTRKYRRKGGRSRSKSPFRPPKTIPRWTYPPMIPPRTPPVWFRTVPPPIALPVQPPPPSHHIWVKKNVKTCRAIIPLAVGMNDWCFVNCNSGFCPTKFCYCENKHKRPRYRYWTKKPPLRWKEGKSSRSKSKPVSHTRPRFRIASGKHTKTTNYEKSKDNERALQNIKNNMYRCRGIGIYSGRPEFDDWCQTNCRTVICPLLICGCTWR